MKNTLRSKTLTASLEIASSDLFAKISDPDQLSQWHTGFCRSLRKENGQITVQSPRGSVPIRFLRDDRSSSLDLIMTVSNQIDLLSAMRVLPNGSGSELVMTLVQPAGLPDAAFHEQVRWAESALRNLRKKESPMPTRAAPAAPDQDHVTPAAVENAGTGQTPETSAHTAAVETGHKLFIGNLPFDWSEESLRTHFADLGTLVSVAIARFRNQGRSRGFGFVEMSTQDEAQNAIAKLHEGLAGGRKIIVRLAHTKDSRPEKATEIAKTPAPAVASAPKVQASRPAQQRRPRETERPPALARRSRSTLPRSPRPSQDIVNKSGYEYFARRAPGSPETPPSAAPAAAPSRTPAREASPYFDDAQDVERPTRRRSR